MNDSNGLVGLDFSPEYNLARYLQNIRKFPILEADEEYELAMLYQKTHDQKIAYKLITSHLRLVVKVVSKYKGYGLPIAEMISEGTLGLMSAIDKFEPEKGFRFSTYALWWIKASVQKYILNSWSLVKLGTTAAQKKLFFNLRKIKNKLNVVDDRQMSEPVLQKIAKSLDVTIQDVSDMNMRLQAHDGSLNTILSDSADSGAEWMDFISDNKPNQEETYGQIEVMRYRKRLFNEALKVLNSREKDILFKRRLTDKAETLEDLSRSYNISKERVRQIELNSIKKISKAVGMLQ